MPDVCVTLDRVGRVDEFMDKGCYVANLAAAVANYPGEYGFRHDKVHEVAVKMREAFIRGSYNHDSRAIRATCKKVGIKHTRKAMEEFFNAVNKEPCGR